MCEGGDGWDGRETEEDGGGRKKDEFIIDIYKI